MGYDPDRNDYGDEFPTPDETGDSTRDQDTYFVAEIEGERPVGMSRPELIERLNGALPDWAHAEITRFDR